MPAHPPLQMDQRGFAGFPGCRRFTSPATPARPIMRQWLRSALPAPAIRAGSNLLFITGPSRHYPASCALWRRIHPPAASPAESTHMYQRTYPLSLRNGESVERRGRASAKLSVQPAADLRSDGGILERHPARYGHRMA
jgi:hypothetical protein